MSGVRTMRGSIINMDQLFKENENTIALTAGGQSLNARGDLIGPGGRIVKKAEQMVQEQTIARSNSVKISLSDEKRFKKLLGRTTLVTEEEAKKMVSEQLDLEKEKAKKVAQKVQIVTQSMASGSDPIIEDHTSGVEEPATESKPKGKRVIVDND